MKAWLVFLLSVPSHLLTPSKIGYSCLLWYKAFQILSVLTWRFSFLLGEGRQGRLVRDVMIWLAQLLLTLVKFSHTVYIGVMPHFLSWVLSGPLDPPALPPTLPSVPFEEWDGALSCSLRICGSWHLIVSLFLFKMFCNSTEDRKM